MIDSLVSKNENIIEKEINKTPKALYKKHNKEIANTNNVDLETEIDDSLISVSEPLSPVLGTSKNRRRTSKKKSLSKQKLSMALQWNINGLKYHYNDFKILLLEHNPHLICLNEIHLKPNDVLNI